jgi:predicted ferric reductase
MAEMASSSIATRQQGSPVAATLLVAVYAALLLSPLIVAAVAGPATEAPLLKQLGRSAALVAAVILTMQAVLAGRLKSVCEHYGLDMVLRFHKSMAVLAVVLVIAHPILLAASAGSWSLITSFDLPWYIWFGKIALLLLIIVGVTSIWQKQLLDFQAWRKIHNIAPAILVLVLVHSWIAGGDLQSTPMRVLWVALFGVAVTAYSLHKFVWPAMRKSKLWSVASVSQETHDVWTVEFEPPEGEEPMDYAPGQFHFVTLYRGDDRYDGEEHHFTISSSPVRGDTHTSSIKSVGDFTSTIGETEAGDRAMIQGPYGRFSYAVNAPDDRYLFIAGGIGITPIMSMLRHMRDTEADVDVTLIYGNKTQSDIVFRDELDEIAAGETPRLSVTHVLSEEEWDGPTGHVDGGAIADAAGEDLSEHSVYVCGPPPMMDEVISTVLEMGAPEDRLYNERFWL